MKKILFLSLLSIAFTACKTDDPKPDEQVSNSVDLTVKMDATYLGQELGWTNWYLTAAGDSIQYDKIKFLLSNITLETENGAFKKLENTYVYLSFKDGRDSFVLKGVEKGKYKSIRFNVGLDSAINHGNPAQWATDHPLSPTLNEMHWGWSGGYIFNVLEGYYKSNNSNAGFSFHIALDRNARIHTFVKDFELNANSRMVFEMHADKYFDNVVQFSLKNDGAFSHSGDVDPVMDKFIQNTNGLFELKSVK